jgi:nucleotide-binding universal stress UspA family protein
MSVLICYDGSPSARHAVVRAAATLSQAAVPHHDVTLLYVWNEPRPATDSFSYREDPLARSAEHLIDKAQCHARELVETGRRLASEHGLMPKTLIAPNRLSVPVTILGVAEQEDSSLIVLGAHPHGTPGPTLDSVSAAVIAASTRPVLVIPMTTVDQAALLVTAGHGEAGAEPARAVTTTSSRTRA